MDPLRLRRRLFAFQLLGHGSGALADRGQSIPAETSLADAALEALHRFVFMRSSARPGQGFEFLENAHHVPGFLVPPPRPAGRGPSRGPRLRMNSPFQSNRASDAGPLNGRGFVGGPVVARPYMLSPTNAKNDLGKTARIATLTSNMAPMGIPRFRQIPAWLGDFSCRCSHSTTPPFPCPPVWPNGCFRSLPPKVNS